MVRRRKQKPLVGRAQLRIDQATLMERDRRTERGEGSGQAERVNDFETLAVGI